LNFRKIRRIDFSKRPISVFFANQKNNSRATPRITVELERVKIIERTTRGTLHRLRQGQITSQGHCIYGYEYVRKSPLSPPALVINEHEAATVRSVFDMYGSGTAGPDRICRLLEEAGIPTRKGKKLWRAEQIKNMLRNHTYTGIRYYNRLTMVKDGPGARGRPSAACVSAAIDRNGSA
jgi:hypothetical protein